MTLEMMPHAADYRQWLGELKACFRQVQLKAAIAVNSAMLQFYWELGADMVVKQTRFTWGSGFLNQLSADLMRESPDTKGFSKRNLELVRQWHLFWLDARIGQQPAAQIAKQPVSQILYIPWGHDLAILAKCKQQEEALYYVQATQTSVLPRSWHLSQKLNREKAHKTSNQVSNRQHTRSSARTRSIGLYITNNQTYGTK